MKAAMKLLIDVVFYLSVTSSVVTLLMQWWSAFGVLVAISVLTGILMARYSRA